MVLDRNDLALLYCLRDKELRQSAIKLTKKGAELFPARQRPHLALIWTTYIAELVEAKKTGKFDRYHFVTVVLEKLKTADMLSENKDKLKEICEKYTDETFELDHAMGKQYLEAVLEETTQRVLSRAVVSSKSFKDISQLVNQGKDWQEDLHGEDEERKLFINPLMNVTKYLKRVPKLPMGVAHFDKVTNGGMSEGQHLHVTTVQVAV